jgi:osmotically-inducible protein OsmY
MKTLRPCLLVLALAAAGALAGCSSAYTKSSDVAASVRAALNHAGYKDVSVAQDQEKGVVTLTGHVPFEADKAQAEALARTIAGGQVVSNEIAVLPAGGSGDAQSLNTDFDKGIEGNLDAALITDKLHAVVKYAVKNQVVTLTGTVESQERRARAEDLAAATLNVRQVVNELQVKDQKASESK